MLRFFSDEKNFVQDMKKNRQNDRWLAESPDEVPIVMHSNFSKYPAHVMVLGACLMLSSEGDVREPVFVPDGLRVTSNHYVGLLEEHVKPWMDKVANGRPCLPTGLRSSTHSQNHSGMAVHQCAIPLVTGLVAAFIARLQPSRLFCVGRFGEGGQQQASRQQGIT